ncbi:uncharacterized protein LOC144163898 [Haemaphysalis longicornis]
MMKYNAYYGCPWCLEEGTPVDRTIRWIPSRQAAPLRTHRSMVQDMQAAFNSQERDVRGMRGPSPLMKLKGFNMVCCMPPDVMHCVLEGVTQQLLDLWMTATGNTWYIGQHEKVLDKRIVSLKPPNTFCRLPRPVKERAQWKASEWFYWLLFYSLPCLKGVLPVVFLTHFALLCQAVFLLMQESVDDRDIAEAEKLLVCFVSRMYTLYGPSGATYNVHQLLHLSKSVEMVGPLWGTSTFPFESANGELLKHVKAAQGVPLQIAERCVMKSWLATAAKFVTLSAFLEGRKNKIVSARTALSSAQGLARLPALLPEFIKGAPVSVGARNGGNTQNPGDLTLVVASKAVYVFWTRRCFHRSLGASTSPDDDQCYAWRPHFLGYPGPHTGSDDACFMEMRRRHQGCGEDIKVYMYDKLRLLVECGSLGCLLQPGKWQPRATRQAHEPCLQASLQTPKEYRGPDPNVNGIRATWQEDVATTNVTQIVTGEGATCSESPYQACNQPTVSSVVMEASLKDEPPSAAEE